jgi:Fe-S-cluster containining protein
MVTIKKEGLFMNDRQKMIEELMKHPIGKDQEFHFHCDQCGECCKNRVDILLSPFDLCRMAKALNKPLPEVLQEYGNLYLGNTSKMPLVSLKMREDNGKCPFLMDDNRCKIHSNKPTVCALYPLGRGASREGKKAKIFYILQPTTCGGMMKFILPGSG